MEDKEFTGFARVKLGSSEEASRYRTIKIASIYKAQAMAIMKTLILLLQKKKSITFFLIFIKLYKYSYKELNKFYRVHATVTNSK